MFTAIDICFVADKQAESAPNEKRLMMLSILPACDKFLNALTLVCHMKGPPSGSNILYQMGPSIDLMYLDSEPLPQGAAQLQTTYFTFICKFP